MFHKIINFISSPFKNLYHIHKVKKVLKGINISTKHNLFSRKTLSEVLTEISAKWSTLDNDTQNNLSLVIAGTREKNIFKQIIDDYKNK